jgi:ABC-type branched-subunit amino acid transport system substrate-binding protein
MRVLGVIFVLLLLTACAAPQQKPQETAPLKIGGISSMSGPAAIYGEAFNKGVTQALAEINADGTKIEFVLEDNKNDPKEAIAAYQRLMIQDPDIIFSSASGSTVAITPLVKETGTPMFATICNAQFQLQYDNSFKYYLSGNENADALVKLLRKKGAKTVSLYYTNIEAGVAPITPVEKKLTEEGFTVLTKEGFPATETDHRSAMSKLANQQPDAIYVWAVRPDQVVGAAKSAYNGTLVFSEVPVLLKLYQQSDDFNGAYAMAMAFSVPGSEQSTAFAEKFGEDTNGYAAFGYDLTYLVWTELQAGATPENVVQRVAAHPTYNGLLGPVTIHGDIRQIDIPLEPVLIKDRTLQKVE